MVYFTYGEKVKVRCDIGGIQLLESVPSDCIEFLKELKFPNGIDELLDIVTRNIGKILGGLALLITY